MKILKLKCKGKSPILMDRMSDEILQSLLDGVRIKVPKDVPAEEVARKKIYRENGDTSKIGLPSTMLFSCLVEAGRNVKNGTSKIFTVKTITLPDFLFIQELFLPFTNIKGKEDGSWKVDKRLGKLWNKGTSVAVCLVRPCFDKWEFTVTIGYDESKIDESTLKALFEKASSSQGLGSFRPNCKGPFGRFKVVSWKEILKKK